MASLDHYTLTELIRKGWSYPKKGGTYCWEKSKVLDDGSKELVGFIAENNENAYPNDGMQGDYYYKRCFSESQTVYVIVTEDGKKYAQLNSQEIVELTATANDIRLGTTAVTEDGVTEGTKDIPSYHTIQGVTFIRPNCIFSLPFRNEQYDYTKLQAMTAPYNTSLSDSVAVDRVVIDDFVYETGSSEPISSVTKDNENTTINFGITNGDSPAVIRYFTYREEA